MKLKNSWFLLASSALMYGLALMISPTLWWGSFICFVPLLYLGTQRALSYKQGFFYGALLWTIGGFGILKSLYTMSSGAVWVRLIPSILIVLIQAIFAGFWFLGTTYLLTKLSITNRIIRLAVWTLTTGLYFYWVIHLSLSMFNYWEGYFLMYPLLPLAEHPELLSWMPTVGKGVLLWILLATNAAFTIPFITKKKYLIWLAPLVGVLPWIISSITAPPKKDVPAWVASIAHIPKDYQLNTEMSYTAKVIQKDIKQVLKKYPDVKLIIFPESSFRRLNLDTAYELGEYWNRASLGTPVSLLVGAAKWEGPIYRNTVYWLEDGKIKGAFNKRHAMALAEEIKGWYNFSFLRALFHNSSPIVAASDNPRVPFKIFDDVSFIPYICSEIFFNDAPDDQHPDTVIAALCKDTWSSSAYIRYLMFLAARFKAIEWQRPIVYVSYDYNGYLDTDGTITPLK